MLTTKSVIDDLKAMEPEDALKLLQDMMKVDYLEEFITVRKHCPDWDKKSDRS